MESLKDNVKITEICRRKEIWSREYYRIKEKFLSGALDVFKNSRKKKDVEKERLKKETEKLRNIILSQAEESNLLKKDQLGLLGPISGYRLSVNLKKKLIDIVEDSLLPAETRLFPASPRLVSDYQQK